MPTSKPLELTPIPTSKPVELIPMLMMTPVQLAPLLVLNPVEITTLLMFKTVPATRFPLPQLHSLSAGWPSFTASHVYPVCRVVLSRFLEFIQQECSGPEGGIPVLVAHNGKSFDNRFLSQECNRWRVPIPGDWQWMDSYLLAKECVRDQPNETVSRALVGCYHRD